jgi:DNA-binding NarL/FixJ family response regulator
VGCPDPVITKITSAALSDTPADTGRDCCACVLAENDVRQSHTLTALRAGGVEVSGVVKLDRINDVDIRDEAVVTMACDLSLPIHIVAIRRIRRAAPELAVVVVSPATDAGVVRRALSSGADGVVFEDDAHVALVPALHAARRGYLVLPRETHRSVSKPAFSYREKQILSMVVRGYRNSEIAARLFLAESTVKSHLSTSFEKLGVSSRRDAAAVIADPAEGLADAIFAVDMHDPSTPDVPLSPRPARTR